MGSGRRQEDGGEGMGGVGGGGEEGKQDGKEEDEACWEETERTVRYQGEEGYLRGKKEEMVEKQE
jgi:hypothetical protein